MITIRAIFSFFYTPAFSFRSFKFLSQRFSLSQSFENSSENFGFKTSGQSPWVEKYQLKRIYFLYVDFCSMQRLLVFISSDFKLIFYDHPWQNVDFPLENIFSGFQLDERGFSFLIGCKSALPRNFNISLRWCLIRLICWIGLRLFILFLFDVLFKRKEFISYFRFYKGFIDGLIFGIIYISKTSLVEIWGFRAIWKQKFNDYTGRVFFHIIWFCHLGFYFSCFQRWYPSFFSSCFSRLYPKG